MTQILRKTLTYPTAKRMQLIRFFDKFGKRSNVITDKPFLLLVFLVASQKDAIFGLKRKLCCFFFFFFQIIYILEKIINPVI